MIRIYEVMSNRLVLKSVGSYNNDNQQWSESIEVDNFKPRRLLVIRPNAQKADFNYDLILILISIYALDIFIYIFIYIIYNPCIYINTPTINNSINPIP